MTPRPERLLHDGLFARAADPAFADKHAVVVEGKPYTYSELRDAVVRLASTLRARGVERGDRVAIYMDNTWPCVVSLYATLAAGGVFLIANPQTKADKLKFILDDSGAKVLLTDGHLAHEFVPVLAENKALVAVIASGTLPEGHGIVAFDDALREGATTLAPSGTIPLDLAAKLPEAAELCGRRETPILEIARSPDFSLEKLKAALKRSAEIH